MPDLKFFDDRTSVVPDRNFPTLSCKCHEKRNCLGVGWIMSENCDFHDSQATKKEKILFRFYREENICTIFALNWRVSMSKMSWLSNLHGESRSDPSGIKRKLGQDLVPWILGQEVSQEAFHQVSIHPDWKIIPEANKENGIFEIELLPHRRLNFWFREKCSRGQKKQHPWKCSSNLC